MMSRMPVAVQLWTLRDEIAKDLPGTLRQVAEIGYAGVELWFQEFPPVDELGKILEDCNLKAVSAHVPFVQLRDGFESVVHYHRALGNTDLAIPIIPEDLRKTEDDWKQRVEEIVAIARRCKDAGLRLSYHNHAVEFEETVDGIEAHDYIFSTVDADLLQAQLDTYFIAEVGKDPAAYIRRYSGRVPLLHIKEKSKTPERNKQAEIGHGVIDWDAVFAAAEEAGVEWYIVEQDWGVYPALESIKISFDYLESRRLRASSGVV
jgi:sugar phosphate isomerase/epimerase